MAYKDIINKKIKEWDCSTLMSGAEKKIGRKIPFSSPLMNYSTYGGIPRNQITEFFGEPGGGKAQPLYSKILTPTGFIEMRDVVVGLEILDGSGELTKIDGVYPQGERETFRIYFKDGTHIDVADNHLNAIRKFHIVDGTTSEECITTLQLIELFEDYRTKDKEVISIDFPNISKQQIPNDVFNEYEKYFKYKDRTIIGIEFLGLLECQCIHVESNRHTYITDNFTITHNTSTSVDLCKNAVELFQLEHEEELQQLREEAAKGNKSSQGRLIELQETGPKKVLYVDLEHSFDIKWSKVLGINNADIDIMQPPDIVAEDLLQTIQELIETGELGLVVLDSIPSLVTRAELEKKYGERTVASLAGLLTVFCRKVVSLLTRYNTTLVLINQVRDNMENPYVINTPGGRAIKFYASLRIYFKVGHPIDFLGNELPMNAENPSGHIITAKIVKQKSAPFDRKTASYYLLANSGIRADMDYAQLAIKKYNIIRKGGAWYTLCNPEGDILEDENGNIVKINGLAKVYEYLQSNPEYYNRLKEFIMNDISGIEPEVDVAEEEDIGVEDVEI